MFLTYFDVDSVSPRLVKRYVSKLKRYREQTKRTLKKSDNKKPEYSLIHVANPKLHDTVDQIKKKFKHVEHVVLVGIGGSNLGTAAVHEVLDKEKVKLSQLDTVSATDIQKLLKELKRYKSVKKIAVCIVSKSGGTAETLANAGVLLEALENKFKKAIYRQTIFIGNAGTPFMRAGKRLNVHTVTMPSVVGGRYSVATEVSLVPLALLGHDTDAFISGVIDAGTEEFEPLTAEAAARIHAYQTKGSSHYNFFAFEKRLYTLGAWYRQLFAESLGKAEDKKRKPVKVGMLPTISTPIELHSVGQLYLSGFSGVYTDFVTFDDDSVDYEIPKSGIAKTYGRFTVQEVATAIYGGVVGAYQEKHLPYRSTIFDHENLAYSLGLFMAMRMREVMYVAHLMGVDAFNQPNVELYKKKTKAILKL
jgi:glucose-6-phosphate isomerase